MPIFLGLIEQLESFMKYFQNEFTEQCVGQGEPRTGEVARIVFVERLVQEPRASSGALECFQTIADYPGE